MAYSRLKSPTREVPQRSLRCLAPLQGRASKVPLAQPRAVRAPSAAAHDLPSAQCTAHRGQRKVSLPSTTAYASRSLQAGPHAPDVPGMPCLPHLHDQVGPALRTHRYRNPAWAFSCFQSTCRFPLADGCYGVAEGGRSWRDATRRFRPPRSRSTIKASTPTALRKDRAFRCGLDGCGTGAKPHRQRRTRSRYRQ